MMHFACVLRSTTTRTIVKKNATPSVAGTNPVFVEKTSAPELPLLDEPVAKECSATLVALPLRLTCRPEPRPSVNSTAVTAPVRSRRDSGHGDDAAAARRWSVAATVSRPTRCLEPWPFANLTAVTARSGHVDDEPVTVTVSHGLALRRGHLDGRYADVVARRWPAWRRPAAREDGGRLPVLLAIGQPGGRFAEDVAAAVDKHREPHESWASGWFETATVTRNSTPSDVPRSSMAPTALYAVIDLPVFFNTGSGLYVEVNVRLPDGTAVTTTRIKRRPGGAEILIPVYGLSGDRAGALRSRYRQQVTTVHTVVDLVIAEPATLKFDATASAKAY